MPLANSKRTKRSFCKSKGRGNCSSCLSTSIEPIASNFLRGATQHRAAALPEPQYDRLARVQQIFHDLALTPGGCGRRTLSQDFPEHFAGLDRKNPLQILESRPAQAPVFEVQ